MPERLRQWTSRGAGVRELGPDFVVQIAECTGRSWIGTSLSSYCICVQSPATDRWPRL